MKNHLENIKSIQAQTREVFKKESLKAGSFYLCILTLKNDDGEILYQYGETYRCEKDNCLTDDLGNSNYQWWCEDYDHSTDFIKHFEKV